MGLENVHRGILERGERQAMEIRKKAQEEAEAILAKARADAQAIVDRTRRDSEAEAGRLRTRELLSAEIEAKKIRLAAEREALDGVLAGARERLHCLPDKERAFLLEALVKQVTRELADARIFAAKEDAALVEELVGASFAGTRPIAGGVVAESADGTITLDLTTDALLDDVWRDSVKDVAAVLTR